MANDYLLVCENSHCTHEIDITITTCPVCGTTQSDPVNVKRAKLPSETQALEKRYNDACEKLKKRNLENERKRIEQLIEKNGRAVINMSFEFVWKWLMQTLGPYESYRRQLMNRSRQIALFGNDVNRSTADAMLFGSEADIIYAALTINNNGASSYGDIAVILKVTAVEKRTSLLETNSFFFIKNIINTGQYSFGEPFPPGHFSTWHDKHKLVIAKIQNEIKSGISDEEIADLILYSIGDRSKDKFVELFIYGTIVSDSVEKIRIPELIVNNLSTKELLQLDELKNNFNVEIY